MFYTELFTLCGYSEETLEKDAPRIEKTLEIAGLGPADMDRAIERLNTYFWMECEGIRKCWGIWLKQFVDLALCREEHEKVIYYTYPLEPRLGCAINCAGYYAATPEFVNIMVLGMMFGADAPYFEAAELNGMTPGTGMCGANKMRLGAFLKGLNPMPDAFIVSSFYCDNEAKTDELVCHHFPGDIPRIYIDNCLSANWDEYTDMYPDVAEHRVGYFGAELRNCIAELKEKADVVVTDEHFIQARMEHAKIFLNFMRLLECMKADPMPISNNDLALFYMMASNPERRSMAEGMDAISLLVKDVEARIERGEGVTPKGAPRIGWLMAWYTDPAINAMVEEVGLAPVVAPMWWVSNRDIVKSKYDDFHDKVAETFIRGGTMHSNSALIWRIEECVKEFNLDGILWNASYACRPAAGMSMMLKKIIEENTGAPVLTLDVDIIDCRDSPIEALRTRIETYTEMLKLKKMGKERRA